MGMIYADISTSLDGFIAGPNVSIANGMGDGGDRLHDWMFAGKSGAEAEAFEEERLASSGAFVMGRTMLDVGIAPWGDNPTFHAPVFVVTHRPAEPIVKAGGTTCTFVTDGPEAALRLAREAAGDQDICVAGGAAIVRHYLHAGVVDELRLHLVPIVLGDGVRLFTGPGRSVHRAGREWGCRRARRSSPRLPSATYRRLKDRRHGRDRRSRRGDQAGTTAIGSISTRKSGWARPLTTAAVMTGGLGRSPHTRWNDA
jgi:dihydrofolate reductase